MKLGIGEGGWTSRLLLQPVTIADLPTLAALHADPRVWWHHPSGRHTSIEQTRHYLLRCERQWRKDGLGYWTVRLRSPVRTLAVGEIAGMGGCALPPEQEWWNLYYRLRPEVHRQGLATELARAAVQAAHRIPGNRAIIARVLEHNVASVLTAERAGLKIAWRGPAVGDPAATRLIFTDQAIPTEQLNLLKALP